MKLYQRIIFHLIFPIVSLIIVSLFYHNIGLTSILLAVWSTIALVFWKSKTTLIIFIFSGLFGATLEIIAIKFGAWNYTNSNFQGIPTWLFILWGETGAYFHQLGLDVSKILKTK
ncbi:MAG: hypothetical protein AABX10_03840 [Nanoarchaeota archaeon]